MILMEVVVGRILMDIGETPFHCGICGGVQPKGHMHRLIQTPATGVFGVEHLKEWSEPIWDWKRNPKT